MILQNNKLDSRPPTTTLGQMPWAPVLWAEALNHHAQDPILAADRALKAAGVEVAQAMEATPVVEGVASADGFGVI